MGNQPQLISKRLSVISTQRLIDDTRPLDSDVDPSTAPRDVHGIHIQADNGSQRMYAEG